MSFMQQRSSCGRKAGQTGGFFSGYCGQKKGAQEGILDLCLYLRVDRGTAFGIEQDIFAGGTLVIDLGCGRSLCTPKSVADAQPQKGTYHQAVFSGGGCVFTIAGDRLFPGISWMVSKIWISMCPFRICGDHIALYDHQFCKLAELSDDAGVYGDI